MKTIALKPVFIRSFLLIVKAVFAYCTLLISPAAVAQVSPPYYDTTYFSKVFGHEKIYRIYLPAGYDTSGQRYPVIYYFHGWGGRYNKDDNANLEYEKIKEIVDKYQLILVMADGNIDTLEPRPYNVGDHNDIKFQVQMKDYFPELIDHIDAVYRTIAERAHRAIMGFSMGGFISFYLAGKYPDKVSAAVSFAGSPEFFAGYPDNHSLYPVRYAFNNLRQVNLVLRNGSLDILYYLNEEVRAGALWDEAVNFQYWKFPGPHMIDEPGETKVYEEGVKFIAHTFDSISSLPGKVTQNWSHYDLYKTFTVWDYQVESNKTEPGFIYLKNVDKKGFGFYTNRWLPEGPSFKSVEADIITAPIYDSDKNYNVLNYNKSNKKITMNKVQADGEGRIKLHLKKGDHEMGIFTPADGSEFILSDYTISFKQDSAKKSRYLRNIQNNLLTVQLLNRGGENNIPGKLKMKITSVDSSVRIRDSTVTVKVLSGQRIITLPSISVSCSKKPPLHAEPSDVRFHVEINASGTISHDEFTVPVFFDAPQFDSIRIDDGILIRDSAYGKGNADGTINSGEKIMLYHGNYNRLRLYTDDPYVISEEERLADEIIPARWPDGYTLSSVIKISPGCPNNHEIEFLASYETKAFNPIERLVHWGRVKIKVNKG
ncbi:MAG TPA: alpha/beta fold hydrolase [Parafilimonas sp.]|nr:alpha/beta fold hydrolase [Parafilimonas sp.]